MTLSYTATNWGQAIQSFCGLAVFKADIFGDFCTHRSGAPPKRILVQGMPGIGKSTFVKKLAVDWAELNTGKGCDKQRGALGNFDILVVINLREVSRCSTLRDAFRNSYIFPLEDGRQLDDLLDYIANNQEQVLLVFDGYDEYHCGSNSELYRYSEVILYQTVALWSQVEFLRLVTCSNTLSFVLKSPDLTWKTESSL